MAVTNLGRVQGASVFVANSESTESVQISSLSPNDITPLISDCVLFPNGDLRKILDINENFVICGTVFTSLKGANGKDGLDGEKGETGIHITRVDAGNFRLENGYAITPLNFVLSNDTNLTADIKVKTGVSPIMTYDSATKTLTITEGN